ncbi:helix-hairpin-helix domain-containing protein [Paenibacillus sacheonensis]|uniref:Pathogenicity locus n=1 Tax=Paenibacillus sacheonensis TaxID=742054 RepID=A0A7X5BYL8_9BACL|nr:helix-hairpin-helix domain-containing protein [Paenibacillus sacheonensis]MBM7569272.1 hypothetical protein [Paenibacillus sacheonensis]NBC71718.1 Pathogenicity locus [Paenibacillus sacheonensis]
MRQTAPKLPLTAGEKNRLRACSISLDDIARQDADELARHLDIPHERAAQLRGLAQFQTVPSIGPKVAQRVVDMGYRELQELAGKDAAALLDAWEKQCGYWEDPCLEDAFRCLVYHADHPESSKAWHDFTPERKAYRTRHGYPSDRPEESWHGKL